MKVGETQRVRSSDWWIVTLLACAALPAAIAATASAPASATTSKSAQIEKIVLPPGFSIEHWAGDVANARSITMGAKGTVFVGTRFAGNVYAVVDHGDRREVKTIASGLHRPNGVAFRDGALYVAEVSRVLRYDDIENRLDKPLRPVVVYDDLPDDESHGWKFIAFGPDGWLYVPVGAPCNICKPPPRHARIWRMRADGSRAEVYARGVRNTVGFDWHPRTKQLWFTDNGRDWLGDDRPGDELNRVTAGDQDFGYPYCHQGDIQDPEFGKLGSCKDAVPPIVKLDAHVAALGMRFYTGELFPPQYRDRIIIAEHGSWNRKRKSGYRLVSVDISNARPTFEVFAQGWLQGESFWGRPVDVHVMPDGSLLVSDDEVGALYRITYRK
jgi:glucose/arabinose dehydrogenase